MSMKSNIQDDLNALKQAAKNNDFVLVGIEKMGNGSMPFYKMTYYRPNETALSIYYFNRHEIEHLITTMNSYKK